MMLTCIGYEGQVYDIKHFLEKMAQIMPTDDEARIIKLASASAASAEISTHPLGP